MTQTDTTQLVNRFYDKLEEQTDKEDRKQKGIKQPDINSKDRKTFIHNFTDVCASMNRDPIVVSSWIAKELCIDTSISMSGTLIMHGTYIKKYTEDKITKYIKENVQCKMCKALHTDINKRDRITYIDCHKCKASIPLS